MPGALGVCVYFLQAPDPRHVVVCVREAKLLEV